MTQNFIHTLYLALAFLLLFGTAEFLYHVLKVEASVTRKIVHICTGLLTMLFPLLIENHWLVLALCGSFLFILLASVPLKLLPSINAVNRTTHGSFIYPIIVYGCYLVYDHYGAYVFYYLPILTLALCDPIAELVGKNAPWRPYRIFGHSKTLSGSLGFMTSSILLSGILMYAFENMQWATAIPLILLIGLISTVAEGLSHKGYDNLSIPLSVELILIAGHNLNYY